MNKEVHKKRNRKTTEASNLFVNTELSADFPAMKGLHHFSVLIFLVLLLVDPGALRDCILKPPTYKDVLEPASLHHETRSYKREIRGDVNPEGEAMEVRLCTSTADMFYIMAEPQRESMAFEKDLGPNPEALPLISWFLANITKLYRSLCEERNICETDWSHLPQENLRIPKFPDFSACSFLIFEKEACLRILAQGLFSFRIFLQYVESILKPIKPGLAPYLWSVTDYLGNMLQSQAKKPESIRPIIEPADDHISQQLNLHIGWTPVILEQIILSNYMTFLDIAASVISHMNEL